MTDCSDESGKGTTRWAGVVGFRPAFVNWRTTEADTELVLETVRGLGARVLTRAGGG